MLETTRARSMWNVAVANLSANPGLAREQFEHAVAIDPGMADAWLGLHSMGVWQDEAVAGMAAAEHRFGEERARSRRQLQSRFDIGHYVTYGLESHLHLWAAVAAMHLRREEYDAAAQALRRIHPEETLAQFLAGRLDYAWGKRESAIRHFRPLLGGDVYFETEARLLSGVALAQMSALAPARDHLTWVLRQNAIPSAHAEARYYLGLVERAAGNEAEAIDQWHHAYALQPDFPGLAEALSDPTYSLIMVETIGSTTQPQPVPAHASNDRDAVDHDDEGDPAETVEEVLADLDAQIGQPGVKRQVRRVLAQARAQVARREAGLPQSRMTEHFVFTGPPGTGKTTIARILGRLYRALGILESGQVIEVDRSGLIGEYHGHTVARTSAVLDSAIGGILFIDEAYALQSERFESGDPFGQEAIDTVLKRMEDERDRLIVIVAGYPEPMRRFIDSNPGLRSRFTTTIAFESYAVDVLVEIGTSMAATMSNVLADDAIEALRAHLTALQEEGGFDNPAFGNARHVRNVVEKAAQERDLRLFAADGANPDVVELTTIIGSDIDAAVDEL